MCGCFIDCCHRTRIAGSCVYTVHDSLPIRYSEKMLAIFWKRNFHFWDQNSQIIVVLRDISNILFEFCSNDNYEKGNFVNCKRLDPKISIGVR